MGKRGPAPKPTKLRVLHGEKNKSRINQNEPQPGLVEVKCPSWLSASARAVWRRLQPDLEAKGVLTGWDVDLFANFCALVVANRQAHEDLARNGNRLTVVDRELSDGTLVFREAKNPNWQIVRESAALMVTIGGRFGLSPSDRAQLSIGTAEESDLESMLADG